jgi:hypothetical protein
MHDDHKRLKHFHTPGDIHELTFLALAAAPCSLTKRLAGFSAKASTGR